MKRVVGRGGGGLIIGPGRMRAAHRKEKGSGKTSGDGSTAMDDPEEREVGRRKNFGAREVYCGISPLGVQGSSRKGRSA